MPRKWYNKGKKIKKALYEGLMSWLARCSDMEEK